jgi:hypothetical protein
MKDNLPDTTIKPIDLSPGRHEGRGVQVEVYELSDCYKKIWKFLPEIPDFQIEQGLSHHVEIMKIVNPDYIKRYGWDKDEKTVWMELKKISGDTADKFPHTPEFIKKVYQFCLDNIKQTFPYAHQDWHLDNIIVDGDNMSMVDWDNVDLYSYHESVNRLHDNLRNSERGFGEKFEQYLRSELPDSEQS